MNLEQLNEAVADAKETMRLADIAAYRVAHLLRGRLRSAGIPTYMLEDLKRELRDFNLHTGTWKA